CLEVPYLGEHNLADSSIPNESIIPILESIESIAVPTPSACCTARLPPSHRIQFNDSGLRLRLFPRLERLPILTNAFQQNDKTPTGNHGKRYSNVALAPSARIMTPFLFPPLSTTQPWRVVTCGMWTVILAATTKLPCPHRMILRKKIFDSAFASTNGTTFREKRGALLRTPATNGWPPIVNGTLRANLNSPLTFQSNRSDRTLFQTPELLRSQRKLRCMS